MSPENLELVHRFGGSLDRYGLGVVVIDCSAENIGALLDAARASQSLSGAQGTEQALSAPDTPKTPSPEEE